jgi:hypothetical protein
MCQSVATSPQMSVIQISDTSKRQEKLSCFLSILLLSSYRCKSEIINFSECLYCVPLSLQKKNSVAFSPQANYTDSVTATGW